MWNPSDRRSAEAGDLGRSLLFPFGILGRKTSRMASLIFGLRTFKLVVVTVGISGITEGSAPRAQSWMKRALSAPVSFLKSAFAAEL